MRIEKNPLTREEALELANKCDLWPAGMGHIIVPTDEKRYQKRGYKRAPNWKPFYWPRPSFENEITCPVLQIAEGRNCNSYSKFLEAWESIIFAISKVVNKDFETTRYYYNDLLKNNPKQIAIHLREYAINLPLFQ